MPTLPVRNERVRNEAVRNERVRNESARNERGVALLVALVALTVIGALVTATFFLSTVEQRTAFNATEAAQALQAAEAGLNQTVGNWDPSLNNLAPGDSTVLASTAFNGSTYRVSVFALNDNLFLVEALGTRRGAVQLAGMNVRRDVKDVAVNASITVNTPINFNGNAFLVDGTNVNPPNLLTCPLVPTPLLVKGVRSSTSTGVGLFDIDNVIGDGGLGSAVANDTSVTRLTNDIFGAGGVYDQLRSLATPSKTLPAGTYTGVGPTTVSGSPGQCDKEDPENWGEPLLTGSTVLPCSQYYPVVLGATGASGELKVTGGRGQGVLLVDGDLELNGGFEFFGLVLVKGKFKITGTGTHIFGAVVAQDGGTVQDNSMSGNTIVQYSSCAISNALRNVASVVPVAGRPWTQLY